MKRANAKQKLTFIISAAVLALGLFIVLRLIIGKEQLIKNVKLDYGGDSQRICEKHGYDEYTVIRASGLIGKSIDKLESLKDSAIAAINNLNYITCEGIEQIGKNDIVIKLTGCEACIQLNYGGKTILLDDEGVVVAAGSTDDVLKVSGLELTGASVGTTAYGGGTVLTNVLKMAAAVRDYNYLNTFPELRITNGEYWFVASNGVLVRVYASDDVIHSLDIAKGIIDTGITSGKIIVSGSYGDYIADSEQNKVKGY